MLLPHRLHRLRHGAVALARVDEDVERREALSIGITRLREKATRLRRIKAHHLHRGILLQRARRGHARGRLLATAQHIFHDALAVDRQRQRFAHAHIVEGLLRHVAAVEVGAQQRVRVKQRRLVRDVARDLRQRHLHRLVQLSVEECALLRRRAADRHKHDAVQLHRARVPVVRIALHFDALVHAPAFQAEGTVAREIASTRPLCAALIHRAVLLDHVLWHREPRVMLQHAREIRRGAFQRELQRQRIDHAHAHLAEIGDLAGVIFLRVLQRVEHVRVIRAQLRREDALIRISEVLRRQRHAIAPFSFGLQMKRPRREGLMRPRSRRARCIVIGMLRSRCDESLKDRVEDHVLRLARREMRIERRGLRTIASEQNARARRLFDARRPMRAHLVKPKHSTREGQQGGDTKNPFHHAHHDTGAGCFANKTAPLLPAGPRESAAQCLRVAGISGRSQTRSGTRCSSDRDTDCGRTAGSCVDSRDRKPGAGCTPSSRRTGAASPTGPQAGRSDCSRRFDTRRKPVCRRAGSSRRACGPKTGNTAPPGHWTGR